MTEPKKENLIWIDLEMTGLDTEHDVIIEIATVITDSELNCIAEGPVFAIHQPDSVLDAMDDWNTKQHQRSGLVSRVQESTVTVEEAEKATLKFIKAYVELGKSPMCGSSICQDRRFLHRHMPKLEQYFHYRNLDVSTVKELVMRWAPQLIQGFKKKSKHMALEDIRDSIAELRYYRDVFMIRS